MIKPQSHGYKNTTISCDTRRRYCWFGRTRRSVRRFRVSSFAYEHVLACVFLRRTVSGYAHAIRRRCVFHVVQVYLRLLTVATPVVFRRFRRPWDLSGSPVTRYVRTSALAFRLQTESIQCTFLSRPVVNRLTGRHELLNDIEDRLRSVGGLGERPRRPTSLAD